MLLSTNGKTLATEDFMMEGASKSWRDPPVQVRPR
jgi:hypothetical protein